MKIEEVYENLCSYDPRNPFYDDITICYDDWEEERPIRPYKDKCSCDSCFRGTDKLALEIIKLRDALTFC